MPHDNNAPAGPSLLHAEGAVPWKELLQGCLTMHTLCLEHLLTCRLPKRAADAFDIQ